MAILKVYSLRDVRTEAFMRPMFVQNQKVIERVMEDGLRDESSNLSRHPEDYQLYYLGEFDEDTGKIDSVPPEFLFNVNQMNGE